ncbi:ABC transporter ATP-binding protein [Psychromicrobium xiongbiense]|uniref:ABC transporter ATP-binding protein n=1 Tax=Psychromicrobium xiongbiense TaxID=3051184 RepID=UPI002552BC7D|nr:ATP-binding cassette domain-containing protein [Psychromicrobium sp. YIM S02556]
MIVFDQVTKVYPGSRRAAVDHLSLSLDRGKITVFVGPSGCGKTTSLRMINRMVEPTSGTLSVDGQSVTAVPAPALRRSMGYVMQSSGLLPHRTVLDNVATVLRLNRVPRARAHARARELLETVGLGQETARRYPHQLSGGQQQRVGVARALAADPPVLLMDEPFSAVDPVVRGELQQELLRLQRELAKTIVFVTHDIDEATVLGDKIAVFALGGRLAQYATAEELLRAPVDDFVAAFVGRDRGFRHLSFAPARELRFGPVPQRRLSAQEASDLHHRATGSTSGSGVALAAVDQWTLLVSEAGSPLGWLSPEDPGVLLAGGSLFRPQDPLRVALDAALSSPAGLGVAVDEAGAVLGVFSAEQVLDAVESHRLNRGSEAVL